MNPWLDLVRAAHGLQHGNIDNPAAGISVCAIAADDFPFLLSPSAPWLRRQDFTNSKKLRSRSFHCSISCARCTRISVLTFFSAIMAAPITVLPKAVVADKTPVSWADRASNAAVCSSRSSPLNEAQILRPLRRSSWSSTEMPFSCIQFITSSKQPRGRKRKFPRYSAQQITRGRFQTGMRMA